MDEHMLRMRGYVIFMMILFWKGNVYKQLTNIVDRMWIIKAPVPMVLTLLTLPKSPVWAANYTAN